MPAAAPGRSVTRAKRGRRCSVCTDPRRQAIDRALVDGEANLALSAKFRGLSDDAIRRHRENHLPANLAKTTEVRELASASATFQQLDRCLERVNKLSDACDQWLTDLDDPTRYDLGPRAGDVKVIYDEIGEDGKRTPRKARLSELLDRVAGVAPGVRFQETKYADPRHLILHAVKRLEGTNELLARIRGELKDPMVLNLTVNAEWVSLQGTIVMALAPFPQARAAVLAALEEHGVAAA
jgi:hypothetical protein